MIGTRGPETRITAAQGAGSDGAKHDQTTGSSRGKEKEEDGGEKSRPKLESTMPGPLFYPFRLV